MPRFLPIFVLDRRDVYFDSLIPNYAVHGLENGFLFDAGELERTKHYMVTDERMIIPLVEGNIPRGF